MSPSVYNIKLNEPMHKFIKLMAPYTFQVDLESPVFADLSISCNNPGGSLSSQKLNEFI